MIPYTSLLVILIGLYALLTKADLIRKTIGLSLFNSGIVLYFVAMGYRKGATAPILEPGIRAVVDPVPQALMLTAIVIGVSIIALALALAIKIHEVHGTIDLHKLKRTCCKEPEDE
jgi:multicomponent Na+:H+ antiporter subunit C